MNALQVLIALSLLTLALCLALMAIDKCPPLYRFLDRFLGGEQ